MAGDRPTRYSSSQMSTAVRFPIGVHVEDLDIWHTCTRVTKKHIQKVLIPTHVPRLYVAHVYTRVVPLTDPHYSHVSSLTPSRKIIFHQHPPGFESGSARFTLLILTTAPHHSFLPNTGSHHVLIPSLQNTIIQYPSLLFPQTTIPPIFDHAEHDEHGLRVRNQPEQGELGIGDRIRLTFPPSVTGPQHSYKLVVPTYQQTSAT